MNRFFRPLPSIAMALSLFTFAACSDESDSILRTPPTETPVEQTPDDEPEIPGDENPGGENPQENPVEEESGITTVARSYESSGGGWKSFRAFEYLPDGKVSKVSWVTHTPYERTGTYNYVYENGLLQKIVTNYGDENIFLWENGRVVRSENHSGGILKNYTLYAYDHAGNVGATEIYHRQSSGEYLLGFRTVYLYFTDGNVYKVLTYVPDANGGDDVLLTTQTYEGYSTAPNPFPMVTILPTVSVQKNLPSYYRYEGHGQELLYNLSYEFREDGYPLQRTVTGGGSAETTKYKYY